MKSASRPLEGLASGRAIARRMTALDPVRDNEEITHLSVEVLYGDPLFVHAAYLVAFARQMAVPSIARVVYRSGTGDMMRDVRRRNDDTIVYFGEMLRRGHSSPRGRAVIDRMEQIHSRFGITHDQKLYTLSSLALEADRIVAHLGLPPFDEDECNARYHFWRGVGERMGLTVPQSRAEFLAWTEQYETDNYGFSEGGRIVVDQLFADWRRWFRGPLARYSDDVLLLLMPAALRAALHLPDPSPRLVKAAPHVVRAYLAVMRTRPHRVTRSWVDHFGVRHPAPLDFTTIGHQGGRTASVTPLRRVAG